MKHTEVQRRKDYIYKLLIDNPMTLTQIVYITGFPSKPVSHYLRKMRLGGYVSHDASVIDGVKQYVYKANKNKPYKMTFRYQTEEQKDIQKEKAAQKILLEEQYQQSLTIKRTEQVTENRRIVRLLDAPLPRAPRTRKNVNYGIGSSFSMFDIY